MATGYPEGCKLCMRGAKLVLFVTGLCKRECYYCPISEKRGGKDISWANEAAVTSPEDVINEAERMRALGAGVTGGEPAVRLERALEYMRLLKEHFDPFHIHMYTAEPLDKASLERLREAGLDELRFHLLEPSIWNGVERAVSLGIETGIEVPAIPGHDASIIKIAKRLKAAGGSFLNLNELEFSDTNAAEFKKRGYMLKSE
ncbi:MAG: radical SAM protein, partial [Candidatus Hydrothermarchaeaceae archaeon]